jgi:zinc transport system substrate-binding protein
MKRQGVAVALLLTGIAVLSMGITAFTYKRSAKEDDGFTVTASFYPMYTAALQVVGDALGVSVNCLTAPTAGCLHDYQLSPDEMAVLSQTDVLVLNGAGAESFLDQALTAVSEVTLIDTSEGVEVSAAEEEHDHDHHTHEEVGVNEHLWVSPARYARQVENLRDGLCRADPARADIYTRNAAAYLEKIEGIRQEMETLVFAGDDRHKAVLFHDSPAYLAQDLMLDVVAVLPVGEDQGVSANTLAQAAEAVRGQQVLLIYDKQYPADDLSLNAYAARTENVILDTAVQPTEGIAHRDAWIAAMESNLQAFKEALT